MPEVVLTTTDVEKRLQELQDKYGFTSTEFQTNDCARSRVSADDEFEWDVYLEHHAALQEVEANLHREYLRRLTSVERSAESADYLTAVAA